MLCATQFGNYLRTFEHFVSVVAQGKVIGGDIGLALGGVNHQGVNRMLFDHPRFNMGGKPGAT